VADIGKINALRIVKTVDFGVYLDGGDLGEILLPRRFVPAGAEPGRTIEVFLYFDSDDRLIATTETPLARVGEFAYLEAVAVESVGAFLNWGLMKDLFVPFREQQPPMERGRRYLVFIYLDAASRRIAASARLHKFLSRQPAPFQPEQEVDILIWDRTPLGFRAIVENAHLGILYKNEVFRELRPGERVRGYVRKIREDGKIDLRLEKSGYGKIDDLANAILDRLKAGGGYLNVTDHSPPDIIAAMFGVSKNAFKMAVGALYKRKLIVLDDSGLTLIDALDHAADPGHPRGASRTGRKK
jgi:predicted RNA-binding protein (virulence factor B family)